MAKVITGTNIREVWDFRLSRGCPYLFNSGDTWVVRIYANQPADGVQELLEEWDSGIPTHNGDGIRNPHDHAAVKKCHEWLYTVRDKYSRPHIELRKPVVAMINQANQNINALVGQAMSHEKKGDMEAGRALRGEAQVLLNEANKEIKAATAQLHAKIAELENGGAH